MRPKKRRLVKGRDYHGWTWKRDDGTLCTCVEDTLSELEKYAVLSNRDHYKPVKVKLLEVE